MRRKWTQEAVEKAVIQNIMEMSAQKGEPTFPAGTDFRLRDSLPSTQTIKTKTGMTVREFYNFLYTEGKIPYKFEPKKPQSITIIPAANVGDRDYKDMNFDIKTRLMRRDLRSRRK